MKYHLFICLYIAVIGTIGAMNDELWQQIEKHTVDGQRAIAIIVPTYNNSRMDVCIRNIESLLQQEYENFHIYIMNDCSTDDTAQKIADYIDKHPRCDKVTLINNEQRIGAMANYYHMIHALPDYMIVINVDGDDWLVGPFVLSYINKLYQNPRIWLTYGQYVEYPHKQIGFCSGYPKEVIQKNSFRKHGLPVSHLRTYYAWLFKKLRKDDLMYEGDFVQATCDKVMMAPMIEMSAGRFCCVQDILYVYNACNPLSDMRIHGVMQGNIRDKLFAMPPYEPLCEPIIDFAIDAGDS